MRSFPPPLTPPSIKELHRDGIPFLRKASEHAKKGRIFLSSEWPDAINGSVLSYKQVLQRSSTVASALLEIDKQHSSPFVASLCNPGADYISALWGTWAAGYASVPLSLSHKSLEMEHVLEDTKPLQIIVGEGVGNLKELLYAADHVGMSDRITFLKDVLTKESEQSAFHLGGNAIVQDMDSPALVIYTSGTTGRPKGVLSTHRNLFHQVTDLVSAWEWQPSDVALHVLPLHHVHGITKLCSAAYVGARLDFQPFDAVRLWTQWADSDDTKAKPNVFMAVPTIYAKLLEAVDSLSPQVVDDAINKTLRPMRLMVSGSAALPVSSFERWEWLTAHRLLERYGMTEFGMAISNVYYPIKDRHPGHVGIPLPSVQVRLVDEETSRVIVEPNKSGSLRVRGPTVFREYLHRPDTTREAFDDNGYFITGDVAQYNAELGSYRILGRASVDILKVGG
jgi:malonyl-CoA/methylmalonyl-CoA synthetase